MKRITVLTAALLAITATPAFAAMSDQEFVTKAGIAGKYAFQSALFATTASPDKRVMSYAQKTVEEKTDLNARLHAIARREKLAMPYALDAEHDDMIHALEAAELKSDGHAQDLYVTQQKKVRDQTIALYERYIREGTNVRLKDYAAASLSTLKEQDKAITPLARMAMR